ncbi:MAG: DUF938 domain-containing protein [Myxococcota bacterium]
MKRHAPAAARNRDVILAAVERHFAADATVLEIASGTGQHAAHVVSHRRALRWIPSDPDPAARASIAAYAAEGDIGLDPPLALDVTHDAWSAHPSLPSDISIDGIICINMIHISPWATTEGLFAGASTLLGAGGRLVLYGPFRIDGDFGAESNLRFDASLRQQDPRWGVRELREVERVAHEAGFEPLSLEPVPANNHIVVFRRR